MKLHWFNPENDMALACGRPNYTPPRAVRTFAHALAQLPRLWAQEDDVVWQPGMKPQLPPDVELAPWGWSAYTVSTFKREGIKGAMPCPDHLRQLSHRRTALRLRQLLYDQGLHLPPEPREITTPTIVESGPWMLKSPWSSSGRGVFDLSRVATDTARRYAANIIHAQGSAMLEVRLAPVTDFACLYHMTQEGASFAGLSVFTTHGANYAGNICDSQEALAARIGVANLPQVIDAVGRALTTLLSGYQGPVGVDMFTYYAGNQLVINPCVEINLRMTMGFVALNVYHKFGRGIYSVAPGAPPAGSLQLIPLNPNFSVTFTPQP